jgi:hypothetical protein
MPASTTVIDLNVVKQGGDMPNDRLLLMMSTMGALLFLMQTVSKVKQTKD